MSLCLNATHSRHMHFVVFWPIFFAGVDQARNFGFRHHKCNNSMYCHDLRSNTRPIHLHHIFQTGRLLNFKAQ